STQEDTSLPLPPRTLEHLRPFSLFHFYLFIPPTHTHPHTHAHTPAHAHTHTHTHRHTHFPIKVTPLSPPLQCPGTGMALAGASWLSSPPPRPSHGAHADPSTPHTHTHTQPPSTPHTHTQNAVAFKS